MEHPSGGSLAANGTAGLWGMISAGHTNPNGQKSLACRFADSAMALPTGESESMLTTDHPHPVPNPTQSQVIGQTDNSKPEP
jgi:hypothetical protein